MDIHERWHTAMTALLLDPKLINYVLICLYSANAARWALHGSWADSTYWLGRPDHHRGRDLGIRAAMTVLAHRLAGRGDDVYECLRP